ncbi:hypothetical protein BDD12DRAFT_853806 [Trichophaea hybrida]|nr:hypothetical protein BDD12DRAFT_853806 [Trichophaea hybrida]
MLGEKIAKPQDEQQESQLQSTSKLEGSQEERKSIEEERKSVVDERKSKEKELERIFEFALYSACVLQSQDDYFIVKSTVTAESFRGDTMQHQLDSSERNLKLQCVTFPGLFIKTFDIDGEPTGKEECQIKISVWCQSTPGSGVGVGPDQDMGVNSPQTSDGMDRVEAEPDQGTKSNSVQSGGGVGEVGTRPDQDTGVPLLQPSDGVDVMGAQPDQGTKSNSVHTEGGAGEVGAGPDQDTGVPSLQPSDGVDRMRAQPDQGMESNSVQTGGGVGEVGAGPDQDTGVPSLQPSDGVDGVEAQPDQGMKSNSV